tara:strand:+ start:5350 stop:8085 length:2736 start_codon:yes stop_codon:yes gene_type:complete
LKKFKIFKKKTTPVLIGNIDSFSALVINGWACFKASSKSIPIQVLVNNHVVGQGFASIYREDLQNAGIHKGFHGFQIDCETTGLHDEPYGVTLRHAETMEIIAHPEFFLAPQTSTFSSELTNLKDGHLRLSIASDNTIGSQTLVLYHQDQPLYERQIETQDNFFELDLPVPVHLQNGNFELYKVGFKNSPDILASEFLAVKPIRTPWQYLRDSAKTPGFLSMPDLAGFRYESLQYQLQAIIDGTTALSAQQVNQAHTILVEGFLERKLFKPLTLPAWSEPKVSIIIPAYNQFSMTYHCIASIALAFNHTSYEVILADDCSSDETELAETIIKNLVVSRSAKNIRFLRNCNLAAKKAKGEYLVFLNNDTEVTSFWLDEMLTYLESDEKVGLVGSKLLNEDGSLQEAGGLVWANGEPWNVGRGANPYRPEFSYTRQVDYVTGAAMAIRAKLWRELEGFSQEFSPCYYEDTDLAYKVREKGYKILLASHSIVQHFEGKSHGTDALSGFKKFQEVNQSTFIEKWSSFFIGSDQPSLDNMLIDKDRGIDKRILVIDYASPVPSKDAGSYAAVVEMQLMMALGYKITFVPENMAHFGKHTVALQKMGVEVLYSPFYTSVYDVLEKRLLEFDAIYITRFSIAEKYIDSIRSNTDAKILFNNADLHFLREMRAALNDDDNEQALAQSIETRVRELAVCQQVDAILCYNKVEHAVITSHIAEVNKLHLTPWVLSPKGRGMSFNKRKGIAFLGGYNHKPNVEAVDFLVYEVMPLLGKVRPDIVLSIYGSAMPDSFESYACDNINVIGYAEHLDEVFHQHRIFVSPLLSGAGIKGKVLEAMAYGTPSVLTDIAGEGTGLTHGLSALFADSPSDWVEQISRCYDDFDLWMKLSDNANFLARDRFSFEKGKMAMEKIFAAIDIK